jgi:hypothetical protein
MMELTAGNCKKDGDRLDTAEKTAIDDVKKISNLKITV